MDNLSMSPGLTAWKNKGQSFLYKGHNIFYIKEGIGEVLLVFHGYPYSSFDFVNILYGLSEQFTVVIPDMLGMGFSDKPKDYNYSFEDYADMYTALLEYLQISHMHVLSHDLGNSIVQEIISRDVENNYPFTIHSIAFLNGCLFTDVYKRGFLQFLLSKVPLPICKIMSALVSKKITDNATIAIFGVDTKPSREQLEDLWNVLIYNNGKAIIYLIRRLVFDKKKYQQRWIHAMQQCSLPMCFINAPADPIGGMHMAIRYNQLIPNPHIIFIDEFIGHWPQLEAPEQVLAAYNEFIDSKVKMKSPTLSL